ncbi:hypothetical protein L6452_38831 [Arctium lappa]|uniref:Uncharacterized protein n=1 Tax=Arctium lappa TaxID=4217 RepID=A0ACB8XQV4_ARCLA|nr:hypothetical protein L6452_38831 [Arctium lappa]
MLGVISNILAFLTTTRFGATSTPGSGNSEVKRAWVGVVPGWVTPWEVSHQVARNKSVRYTLVKSRGKADNIVVEASEMLQVGIRALSNIRRGEYWEFGITLIENYDDDNEDSCVKYVHNLTWPVLF